MGELLYTQKVEEDVDLVIRRIMFSAVPIQKPETLRARSFNVDVMGLGAWLRSGEGAWSVFHIFVARALCYYRSSLFVVFCFVYVFMLSLELCKYSSDIFLSSRPRTGLATTQYVTGYG